MPILQAELKLYKSQTVSDAAGNGGRMSASEITSGAMSNVFPTVGESERTAGSTKYRKVFPKNANDADLAGAEAKVYLDRFTAGDDSITFTPGTQTDTQAAMSGTDKFYGCAKLDVSAAALATTIEVLVENADENFFEIGDEIRITDMVDVDDEGSNEEYVTLTDVDLLSGDAVRLTFTPALANAYSASVSRVMSVYRPGADMVATVGDLEVNSVGSGDFNPANLLADNIGSIEQVFTFTFTNANSFNIVGDTVGAVGSGSTGAGAAPNNADFSKPYFVLQSTGFSGVWQAGDTLVFQTHPAAVPIWLKRVVPAGAAALTVNEAVLALDLET